MNRLVYGVSSAPAMWQRTIEQILQGIDGVQCILDDMVITGENDDKHVGIQSQFRGTFDVSSVCSV